MLKVNWGVGKVGFGLVGLLGFLRQIISLIWRAPKVRKEGTFYLLMRKVSIAKVGILGNKGF